MKYLAEKLRLDRILHGVECSEETDNKILVDGWEITINPKVKGDAERIILLCYSYKKDCSKPVALFICTGCLSSLLYT